MTIKLPGDLELTGTEVCSKEGCGRPAAAGTECVDGTRRYRCAPHDEIGLLQGQYDWLDGEADSLENWLEQAREQAEGLKDSVAGLKLKPDDSPSWLLLVNEYVTNEEEREKYRSCGLASSWAVSFESLLGAVSVARRLTEEELVRQKRRLDPGF